MSKNTKISIVFPQGEFTIKSLILATNKSQPHVHAQVKAAIAAQQVKEVRRESKGKGRPAVVYQTI